ncbi:Scr1 family TA system antitoxin-like transcriptional regulator [Actinoplanes sp. NPDC051470]|uniref:Scr1 family TA system antitoxin-like transcriptional regulator n=1 Tax=Actinoplanes sp. NPDC051470 TaxID=3157224 RepID=UPI00342E1C76
MEIGDEPVQQRSVPRGLVVGDDAAEVVLDDVADRRGDRGPDRGAVAAAGGEFAEPDPPMVYTENASGGLFLEAEQDVVRYRDHFHRLTAQAVSIEMSKQIIEEAA